MSRRMRRAALVSVVAGLAGGLGLGCAAPAPATQPAAEEEHRVTFRIHAAADEPMPDGRAARDEAGGSFYVAVAPFITQADVRDAAVARGAARTLIRIELAPSAAARLERVTAARGGVRLAVYIDDQIIVSPSVRAPVRDGVITLDGGFTGQRADEIVRSLNAQRLAWTPGGRGPAAAPPPDPERRAAAETPEAERSRLLRELDAGRGRRDPLEPEMIIEP